MKSPAEDSVTTRSSVLALLGTALLGTALLGTALLGCAVEDPCLSGATSCDPCTARPDAPECAPSCDDDPLQPRCVPPAHALGAEVEILRDSQGIPHVYAASDLDAMYASGYMQAFDRLFQMDLARRQARGRLAELFGLRRVRDDQLMRTLDLAGWAEQTALRMRQESPAIYALLVAWTAGVNARIDEVLEGRAPLPYGFGPDELAYAPERWSVLDGAAVGKLLLFGSSVQLENDILATIIRTYVPTAASIPLLMAFEDAFALPEEDRPRASSLPATFPPTSPPLRPLPPDAFDRLAESARFFERWRMAGSNNWAVAGRHTTSGRSMIAGDPHQPLRSPNVFWLHHLNSADRGGTLDLIGFNFVGTPGVQLGHNDRLVWTATITSPDMMDLWGVRTTPDSVRVGAEDVPLVRRDEVITIRDAAPQTLVVETVPGFGVLLPDDIAPVPVAGPGRRLLFNWTGFAPTDDFGAFLRMSTARTTDAFEAAVDTLDIGAFNWVAADRDSIAYVSSMAVPRRSADLAPRQPWMVLDGDDAESLWTNGMLPREWLPRSRGGARGWLATANADPYGFTADGDVTNDPFYFGAFYDPGTRAARAEEELARLVARGDVTLEDMQGLQMDTYSRMADRMIALLEEAWVAAESDASLAELRGREDLATLHDLLVGWDRRMDRTSSAAVVYNALVHLFAERAIGDELSFVYRPVASASGVFALKLALLAAEDAFPGGRALLQDGLARTALTALAETASWLETRFGSVDPAGYTWADVKASTFRNEYGGRLDQGEVATDGGDGTLNVSAGSAYGDSGLRERIQSSGGAVYRMVATFGEDGVPEARLNYPPGNSADPDSRFFSSTLEDWVEGRYAPLRFRRADVDADAQERITLSP